jgi:hypothetical protein
MTRRDYQQPDRQFNLHREFERIHREQKKLVAHHASQVVLGASVMRVFAPGTKKDLLPLLPKLPLFDLQKIQDQESFEQWFDEQLDLVAQGIMIKNKGNSKVNPGYKWGHATKILNLYLREIVLNSRYFKDSDTRRLSFFLYVPIDSKIMDRMRRLGFKLPFRRIKEIRTKDQFMHVQQLLGGAATKAKVPRIWFDYVWGEIESGEV